MTSYIHINMRKLKILLSAILILALLILFIECDKDEGDTRPDVSIITDLTAGDAFELGELVIIQVELEGRDRMNIDSTIINIDGEKVFDSDSLCFKYEWNTDSEEIGKHVLDIIAVSHSGLQIEEKYELRIYIVNDQACSGCETITDYDGNIYNTIQIGDQCWMKENLKVTHFSDGTPLVDGTGAMDTQYDTITKYYFNYNNDVSYVETYGRLYIWMAAVNGEASEIDLNPSQIQGVCPTGWHLPSDSEWKELEMFLGMSAEEAQDREWRGTIEGGMLKERSTGHWETPNQSATNESGFTALPAGHRNLLGDYKSMGKKGSFWSSTNHVADNMTQNPAYRLVNYEESRTFRYQGFHGYLTYARSVRCVKNKY